MKKITLKSLVLLALASFAGLGAAHAADFPERPVHMVIPFAAEMRLPVSMNTSPLVVTVWDKGLAAPGISATSTPVSASSVPSSERHWKRITGFASE